mmetsp:Transcript_73179/g.133905  ORF Transcript_73179/g.133905 Transcript_73179/m.133905 type:complete len:127 (-) Transcript_73179:69-449(-)
MCPSLQGRRCHWVCNPSPTPLCHHNPQYNLCYHRHPYHLPCDSSSSSGSSSDSSNGSSHSRDEERFVFQDCLQESHEWALLKYLASLSIWFGFRVNHLSTRLMHMCYAELFVDALLTFLVICHLLP